jgi:PmbA protein
MMQEVVVHRVRVLGLCLEGHMPEFAKSHLEVSSMEEQLLEAGTHVIEYAEHLGANQVEAYLESNRTIEVTLEKGMIKLTSEKLDVGCGIRVVIGKQLGISYVTSILEKDLNQAALDAFKAGRFSIPDVDFSSFTSCGSSYPNIKGLFDRELNSIECEQAAEILMRSVNASREVSGTERNMIEGSFIARTVTKAVINSIGVTGTSRETKAELNIYSSIGMEEKKCSSSEYQNSCTLEDINPEVIGAASAQKALQLRGSKTITGGEMPLILSPEALKSIFGSGLVRALDAKQVQDGKSYLVDNLGAQIASLVLEVYDNGLLSGALGSRPFDAEGTPSHKTPLISSGILQSYLHDSYSSTKDGINNTGNASRNSYKVTPRIDASNLVVMPGRTNLDQLISEVDRGVICTYTLDTPNVVTGELSAMIMEGFFISDGEIKHALKNTLFGTTMQDLLKKTIIVGSDVEQRGSVISPSLLVESTTITSG